jgi:ABC-2 type transport system permease protein
VNLSAIAAVVRQDLLDVRRARLVQAVLGGYVLFVGVLFGGVGLTEGKTVSDAIRITLILGFLFVPLVALLTGYLSVAGERESGSLRLLLGYGVDRREVVLGKYLSRVGLVALGITTAFCVAGMLAVSGLFPEPQLATIAVFGGVTVLFAAAYVAVGVAISTVSSSRRQAMTRTVAVYFVFTLLWSRVGPTTVPALLSGVIDTLTGTPPSGTAWAVFNALSPAEAYFQALALLPGDSAFGDGSLDPSALVVILLAWIVVPTLLGTVWFVRTDIE